MSERCKDHSEDETPWACECTKARVRELEAKVGLLSNQLCDARADAKSWSDQNEARVNDALEAMRQCDSLEAQVAAMRDVFQQVESWTANNKPQNEWPQAVYALWLQVRDMTAMTAAQHDARVAELHATMGQLAAMREAIAIALAEASGAMPAAACNALVHVVADTATTAAQHEARVKAEALREAAGCIMASVDPLEPGEEFDAEAWLRDRADEIEKGEGL